MIDYKTFSVEAVTSLYDCGNRLRRQNMMAVLPDLHDRVVLELGFGIGDFLIEIKNRKKAIYKRYIGVDISFPNLDKARQFINDLKLYDNKISFVQADIFKLPFEDESTDIVICAEVLEHLDDAVAMHEINRILKYKGFALITVPYLGKPVTGWGHLRHYDLDMFQSLIESSGFSLQNMRIFGRFHEISWVKFKRFLFIIWGIWKKISSSKKSYYESKFHRGLIMPIVDRILVLDGLFSRPKSILGDKGYLVALIQKIGVV